MVKPLSLSELVMSADLDLDALVPTAMTSRVKTTAATGRVYDHHDISAGDTTGSTRPDHSARDNHQKDASSNRIARQPMPASSAQSTAVGRGSARSESPTDGRGYGGRSVSRESGGQRGQSRESERSTSGERDKEKDVVKQRQKQIEKMWNERAKLQSDLWDVRQVDDADTRADVVAATTHRPKPHEAPVYKVLDYSESAKGKAHDLHRNKGRDVYGVPDTAQPTREQDRILSERSNRHEDDDDDDDDDDGGGVHAHVGRARSSERYAHLDNHYSDAYASRTPSHDRRVYESRDDEGVHVRRAASQDERYAERYAARNSDSEHEVYAGRAKSASGYEDEDLDDGTSSWTDRDMPGYGDRELYRRDTPAEANQKHRGPHAERLGVLVPAGQGQVPSAHYGASMQQCAHKRLSSAGNSHDAHTARGVGGGMQKGGGRHAEGVTTLKTAVPKERTTKSSRLRSESNAAVREQVCIVGVCV
jgi:hypothetical protein